MIKTIVTRGRDKFAVEREFFSDEPLDKIAQRVVRAVGREDHFVATEQPDIDGVNKFLEALGPKAERLTTVRIAIRQVDEAGGGALNKHQLFAGIRTYAKDGEFPFVKVDDKNDFYVEKDGLPVITSAKAIKAAIDRYMKIRDNKPR